MLEVLFEVAVAVLKYEVEFFVPGDDFFEVDDVGVFEDFEEGDFSDCGGGESFILMIESNFFECNNVVGLLVSGFVDDAVSALSDFVDALELVVFGVGGGVLMEGVHGWLLLIVIGC